MIFGSPSIAQPEGTKANLIWHRPGSGMGDLSFPWKPDYEFIHIIGNGFSHKRRGSSVLSFAWDDFRGNLFHPHQKPLPLMKYLIERCNAQTIFDPFMGSGTTGVACMQLGRNFIGCEIDPTYFAIAEKRIRSAQAQLRMEL
jgi:DNA modification methylase